MRSAGEKPRHFMAQWEGQMRSGYFKVDETPVNASIIFPAHFVGATPVVELREWLCRREIFEPVVYVPAARVAVPITEVGVSN